MVAPSKGTCEDKKDQKLLLIPISTPISTPNS